jgi:solute carrier family 25 carnitine/acylcarnitine transporter 20/29
MSGASEETRAMASDRASTRDGHPPTTPWAVDLSCGIAAGMAYTVVAHPFDTVKVAMQSRASHLPARGTAETVRDIVRGRRGALGLFKGLSAPLVGYSLECGINYAAFSQCRQWLERHGPFADHADARGFAIRSVGSDAALGNDREDATEAPEAPTTTREKRKPAFARAAEIAVSGALGGFLLSGVVSPTDLIKCRVQDGQYSGPREAILHIYKTDGLKGFARGLNATMLREIPGNALFFVVYETAQAAFPRFENLSTKPSSSRSSSGSFETENTFAYWAQESLAAISCGGVAGCAFWLTMLPVDYAKTRLQIASRGGADDVGVFRLIARTARERGFRGLYAGAWPTLLRAFPANAAQFLAWELACQAAGVRRVARA